MDQSLCMIECRTVAAGIQAADLMAKTAGIRILQSQIVFPGKYIVIFCGELSALKASMQAAGERFSEAMIDSFILGNPHPDLFAALDKVVSIEQVQALGLVETLTVASGIVAADMIAKAAKVRLLEIRLSREMGGKAYVLFTGTVASVEESCEIACRRLGEDGHLLDYAVIPNPDEQFWQTLIN